MFKHVCRVCIFLVVGLVVIACEGTQLPGLPQEPADLPGWQDIPGVIDDLNLPELSGIPNLPELADLPVPDAGPGAVAFAGPTERRLQVGEPIPGTDIRLSAIVDGNAEFEIAGLRSVRSIGDSLDYDGAWPEAEDVEYSLRLRIYNIGANAIRAAGVHRLLVRQIQPTATEVSQTGTSLQIPYTASASAGETLKGLTIGYAGSADRGAELSGLPSGEFPYRKVGDSLRWEGLLRPDLAVRYELRVLYYNERTLQVGGIATLQLPNP